MLGKAGMAADDAARIVRLVVLLVACTGRSVAWLATTVALPAKVVH